MSIELGKKVRDKITGFEGICTSRVTYLTGCDQYGVTPPISKEGEVRDARYFDEGRLEVIGNGIAAAAVQLAAVGGDHADAPPR